MNKRIFKRADSSHYPNAEHSEFNRLSLSICQKHSSVISDPALLEEYNRAVTQEFAVFKSMRRSDYTEKKAEIDKQRDNVFLGIIGIARTNLRHFEPTMRDAATHLHNILASYGDVPRSGYDSETASIDNIIIRLRSEATAPAVQMLGLTGWVDKMQELNVEFKALVDNRAQEEVNLPTVTQKVARRETDTAFRQIINRVEARIILGEASDYTDFVDEQNILIKHYNNLVREHYGRLHARTDIAPSIISPIEAQKYTGKPVFVIPELRLRRLSDDGKEIFLDLIFSVDFTLTYRNNINRGTATLLATGIGKYKGELTTTFNIF